MIEPQSWYLTKSMALTCLLHEVSARRDEMEVMNTDMERRAREDGSCDVVQAYDH